MTSESWAGIIGVAVGAITQIVGNVITQWCADNRAKKVDEIRKKLLVKHRQDSGHGGWVRVETLSQMVGAPLEHTRRLLIECKARGSLKMANVAWALIARHPLKVDE